MKRIATVGAAVLALIGVSTPAQASPGFHLAFSDTFQTPVRLGQFRDCDHNTDTKAAYCSGLPASVRRSWWAYPSSWPDTATQWGYAVGGWYHPEDTVWITPGALHIRMYRPRSGAPIHSATLVPKALMGQRYGAYEERWRVVHAAPGYKSAHLLWPDNNSDCCEEDFPEGDWDSSINGYNHTPAGDNLTASDTGSRWTTWRTTRIEWKPGSVRYYLDGRLVDSTTRDVPRNAMNWDIQNESSLDGETAAPGSWAQMDISYVRGWSWS